MYQFPECDSDEDEEFKQLDKELKVSLGTHIWLSSMQSGADHQAHTPAVVSVNSVEG